MFCSALEISVDDTHESSGVNTARPFHKSERVLAEIIGKFIN